MRISTRVLERLMEEEDREENDEGDEVDDAAGVARLLDGFGGEGSEREESDLQHVREEEGNREREERKGEGTAPLPEEERGEEREEEEPVSLEDGIRNDGAEAHWIPRKFEDVGKPLCIPETETVHPLEEEPWEEDGGGDDEHKQAGADHVATMENALTGERKNGEGEGEGEGGEVEDEAFVLCEGEKGDGEGRKEKETETPHAVWQSEGTEEEAGSGANVGGEEHISVGIRRMEEREGETPEDVETEEAKPESNGRAHGAEEESEKGEVPHNVDAIHEGFRPRVCEDGKPCFRHGNSGGVGVRTAIGRLWISRESKDKFLMMEDEFPAHVPVVDGVIDVEGSEEERSAGGDDLDAGPNEEDTEEKPGCTRLPDKSEPCRSALRADRFLTVLVCARAEWFRASVPPLTQEI